MKNLLCLGIFLFNILFTHSYASVDVQSTFITSNDGLGNNFVRHIFQDSKGFLWMSTLNGLTRYDGHSFVTFRPEKGDNISLIDHHVREVSEDKNQFLWIRISPEFYNCYDLKRECFVDFTGCGEHANRYSHRFEASNGDTWLWHHLSGCRRISYKDGRFESTVFRVENGKLPSNFVRRIKEDAQGNMWVCTDGGLAKITGDDSSILDTKLCFIDAMIYGESVFLLTPETNIYKIGVEGRDLKLLQRLSAGDVPRITASFSFRDNWIVLTPSKGYTFNFQKEKGVYDERFDIPNGRDIKDNEGNLCIYNDKGLIRYVNEKNGISKDLHLEIGDRATDQWCNITRDARGWIWIATFGNGLYIYNPLTDEITHFSYQVDGLNRICSNSLAFIMEDRSGGIWVTSESTGITHLSVLSDRAAYFYPQEKNYINNANSVRLIKQMRNGEIMIGNRNGDLYGYDKDLRNKREVGHYPSSIYSIMEDRFGKVWMGTRGHGLYIDGERYVNQIDNPNSISSDRVFEFYCDSKDRIWIGTFGGGLNLAVPNGGGYTFRQFLAENVKQRDVRYVTGDKNGWMWVGTTNGLYVVHPDSLISTPGHGYLYNYDNGKLLANQVKYILRDSKDRMWIGTFGGGLSLCTYNENYANLSFRHFTAGNGLVDNVIQSMAEDNEGKIWIATEYGISRFSPEVRTFENFFFSSNVQGNVYCESSVMKFADGRLCFGTNHGMVIIDPKKIEPQQVATNIALTDLKVNGVSMHPNGDDSPLERAITYTNQIELKHYQNSFIVDFSTFDYSMTRGSRYTYRLEPFDADWSMPSSLNFAAYKKLAPGNYRLHVKACNSAGVWSEEEATLDIEIKPPFWQSSIAYVLYIVFACLALYLVFRVVRNFNTLRNRIEVEKQLTEYKLMFFTNISHEFRTPLTLIKGGLEKIESLNTVSKDMVYPIRLMSKNTDRLLRLVNQLLEFRKMQNNKLALMLEEADVILFFQEIYLNFEEVASERRINYRFNPPRSHYNMYIDKGKLDKIVYNLLSNAFKYTPDGGSIILNIHMEEESEQFIFSVSDTGVGIPKDKQRELFSRFMQSSFSSDSVGVGLHLTYELVNVHKGCITYEEREGGGSVFTVALPLDIALYDKKDFILSNPASEASFIRDESSNESVIDPVMATIDEETKRKILLIEDDKEVRQFLKAELSRYFEVLTASDGVSGLECAQTFDGDLIICDVLMPGMNGFEVTRRLKSNFETSHIPIVLLTAMSTIENQVEGTKSGADAYITKPFSLKLLLARISQLIEQREKLRDKFYKDPTMVNPILSTTELDQRFAEKLRLIMEKELGNPDFTIDDFAAKLNLGRTVFFRKVKGVTGYTPNEYMRVVRMKKAMELLQGGHYNVSEITYRIGMRDPHYFSRSFKDQFGVAPSVYLKGEKE